LTLLLLAVTVLMASGATGFVVISTGNGPPAGGSQRTPQNAGSPGQRPAPGQQATAQARSVSDASAASDAGAGIAAGWADRYNVGAAHSPELLRELAGPLAGTGVPAGDPARGVDVAAAQHPGGAGIDWPEVAAAGYTFAAVKATEGIYYANPYYAADTAGARAAGLQVTGYHVAIPNVSGGAAQADYAVSHLGRTADGGARPLELDVEYDPYTGTDHTNQCYGLTGPRLVSWIGAFTGEAQRLTGQAPVIFTTAAWWRACTGDSGAFSAETLWVAGDATDGPSYPASWASWSYWQFTSAGTVPGIAAGGATDVSYGRMDRTVPVQPAAGVTAAPPIVAAGGAMASASPDASAPDSPTASAPDSFVPAGRPVPVASPSPSPSGTAPSGG
jgi:lysozyme